MAGSPTLYKYFAVSAPGWMQAYGYPEGWSDKEWIGSLSKEYIQRYAGIVWDDVTYGASHFRRVISFVYSLESRLLDRHVPSSESELHELVRDTLLFFAAKYIIRDLYFSLVSERLRKEFSPDSDIFLSTRPDIATVLSTDPRYADVGWDTPYVKVRDYVRVDRFSPERYVRKYRVLWDSVLSKGAPPEVVIKYLSMLYVYDEAVAFVHREDFATFNAVFRVRRALPLVGLSESHLLSRGWLAYDGTKVLD